MEVVPIANSKPLVTSETAEPRKPPYRPPIGVPAERPARWGLAVSLVLHALIIALFVGGVAATTKPELARGAGGAGPMGGGGGGRLGLASPARQEAVKFVRIAAARPTPPVPPTRITPPVPIVTKPHKPVEQKPVIEPQIAPTEHETTPSVAAPTVVAVAPAAGAGTDGTNGAGPGTGGGVGTGNGTGRGSATGPGTGGGEGTIYPATPDFAVIPPLPVPKRLHGKTLQLRFTIDESGRVVKFDFDPTGDSGYDRELKERLSEYHFRPAHKMDGTPVPSVFVTEFVL